MSIIASIKSNIKPEGRAMATASTFELFMSVTGISEGSLKQGLTLVSVPYNEDEPANVSARRATCKEVANLIEKDHRLGEITATDAWGKWVSYLKDQVNIVPDDQRGRYAAMLATAERELAELQG